MDRLIIETTLADTHEIYLSKQRENQFLPAIVLEFKESYADQVTSAFAALKKLSGTAAIELVVCRTLSAGIYDLEIKTGDLDEPVRICNKSISQETLEALEPQRLQDEDILLGSNVLSSSSWLRVRAPHVKEC